MEQGQIETLLLVAVASQLFLFGFLHIFGGSALGKRLFRLEVRAVRAIIGYPVLWAGQIGVWAGRKIIG
jgi:hypothetical protein